MPNGEVAQTLVDKSTADHSKWLVQNFPTYSEGKVFVIFEFKKPILLRGYGVKSANDWPTRDPMHIQLSIVDFMQDN